MPASSPSRFRIPEPCDDLAPHLARSTTLTSVEIVEPPVRPSPSAASIARRIPAAPDLAPVTTRAGASGREDKRGLVTDVRMIEHVNPWIDQQAIDLALTFVFYPAQNDAGEPIASTFPWKFVITN